MKELLKDEMQDINGGFGIIEVFVVIGVISATAMVTDFVTGVAKGMADNQAGAAAAGDKVAKSMTL